MSTMTPQDVAQLNGRDLDAAIHKYIYDDRWADFSLQHYADDDALAFQAADKVQLFELSDFERHNTLHLDPQTHLWTISRINYIGEIDEDIATGATRAEAVCRASLLLAMEGKAE